MPNNKTYLIAAGGTGGHILPGIAIADKILEKNPNDKVIFCGTKNGMENTLVKKSGYNILHIKSSGVHGKFSIRNILFLYNFFLGFLKTLQIIKNEQVDVVIGTGGYVCGPVVYAGHFLKKPTIIHEQNAYPGKANVWLSKYASVVCISFENSRKYFTKANNIVLTGNPVRKEFYNLKKKDARKILNISDDKKLVFVTGGSLGAKSINEATIELANNFNDIQYKIILAAGQRDYVAMKEKAQSLKERIEVKGYLYNQHIYMAACDLILCRAGAITCSEVALLGKPSIMVPYPYAAGDHQTYNAKTFSDIGASILIRDSQLNAKLLYDNINKILYNQDIIEKMQKLSLSLASLNSSELIYNQLKR